MANRLGNYRSDIRKKISMLRMFEYADFDAEFYSKVHAACRAMRMQTGDKFTASINREKNSMRVFRLPNDN